MKTYLVGERDLPIQTPNELWDWLDSRKIKNKHVRNELALVYHTSRRDGEFKIHTGRFDFATSGHTRKLLAKVLNECPFIELVTPAVDKRLTAVYKFVNLPGIKVDRKSADKKQPTDSTHSLSLLPLPPSLSLYHRIEGDWLRRRAERWGQWCEREGLPMPVDYFGSTEMGRLVNEGIEAVEVPTSMDWLAELPTDRKHLDRLSARESGLIYYRRCVDGVMRQVRMIYGRCYHHLSQCPRVLRWRLRFSGEPMGEADLAASYYTLLAGMMPAGRYRDWMIDLVTSGGWYDWLLGLNAIDVGDNPEATMKVEAMHQLVFFSDRRVSERPLWRAVVSKMPPLGHLINRLRSEHGGESGLAHYLSDVEGSIMRPALSQLYADGILCLPLHDGILTGASNVERAVDLIRQSGRETLGFTPLVRPKPGAA